MSKQKNLSFIFGTFPCHFSQEPFLFFDEKKRKGSLFFCIFQGKVLSFFIFFEERFFVFLYFSRKGSFVFVIFQGKVLCKIVENKRTFPFLCGKVPLVFTKNKGKVPNFFKKFQERFLGQTT